MDSSFGICTTLFMGAFLPHVQVVDPCSGHAMTFIPSFEHPGLLNPADAKMLAWRYFKDFRLWPIKEASKNVLLTIWVVTRAFESLASLEVVTYCRRFHKLAIQQTMERGPKNPTKIQKVVKDNGNNSIMDWVNHEYNSNVIGTSSLSTTFRTKAVTSESKRALWWDEVTMMKHFASTHSFGGASIKTPRMARMAFSWETSKQQSMAHPTHCIIRYTLAMLLLFSLEKKWRSALQRYRPQLTAVSSHIVTSWWLDWSGNLKGYWRIDDVARM